MDGHSPLVPPLAAKGHLALTESELIDWGERFGRAARPPLVVTLSGDLGSGKTTLAQAICRGYGVPNDVTSPTFTLVHEYAGVRSVVYHLDLYRLRGPEELANLGWEDILEHLRELKESGIGDVVVAPVGFISDHMEVLYDLDTEARQLSEELGLNMIRAATVGTHPDFIKMIRELILERLDETTPRRSLGALPPSHDLCPADCCLSGMTRPAARPNAG